MVPLPKKPSRQRGFVDFLSLFSLVVLLLGLVAGTYLVGQRQELRKLAALPPEEGGPPPEEIQPPPPEEVQPPPPPEQPPPEQVPQPPPPARECTNTDCGCETGFRCAGVYPNCSCEAEHTAYCADSLKCQYGCSPSPQGGDCNLPPPPPEQPPPGQNPPPGCQSNADCGSGQVCTNGQCITSPPPPQQVAIYCGDNICNGTETCSTCPADCGACPAPEQNVLPTPVPTPYYQAPTATIPTVPPTTGALPAIQATVPYGGTTVGYGTSGPYGNYPSRADTALNKELEGISNAGIIVAGTGLTGGAAAYIAPEAAAATEFGYIYGSNLLSSLPTWAQVGLAGGTMAVTAYQCGQGNQDACMAAVTGIQAAQLQQEAAFQVEKDIQAPSIETLADVASRWRTKLVQKGVEFPTVSPEAQSLVSSQGTILGGGSTNLSTGKIVVLPSPLGAEAEFAPAELATNTHELFHRTRVLSGNLSYSTRAEQSIEEAGAISSEFRFTKMLGIELPKEYRVDRARLLTNYLTDTSNLIKLGDTPRNYDLFLTLKSRYPNMTPLQMRILLSK